MTPLVCPYGQPSDVWTHRHHCAGCEASVLHAVEEMRLARLMGEYDAQNFTPNERKNLARRARLSAPSGRHDDESVR